MKKTNKEWLRATKPLMKKLLLLLDQVVLLLGQLQPLHRGVVETVVGSTDP
jgi:hypothetical protein